MTEWLYEGEPFTDSKDYEGFVYLITNKINGKMYVGKKFFKHKRTRKPLKGKKRKRIDFVESDWKSYYGSSALIKEAIEEHGKDNFERLILSLHKSRAATNYEETREQFARDVLYTLDSDGERVYYNDNINGRFYIVEDIMEEKNDKKKTI